MHPLRGRLRRVARLTPPLLGETCGHPGADGNSRAPDSLRLVFLCACHSQVAAAAFVKLGVPHVIAVQSSAKLEDQAAVKFTRHLYLALAGGKAVKFAFEAGQKAVASMPKNQTPGTSGMKEAPKFQLMGAGDPTHGHDVPIFIDLPDGTVNDTSPTLCPSNLPVLSEHFVGRQTHMHSAVKELLSARRRYVCIVGAGGIGKTALGLAVAHYLRLRHAFIDGVHHVDVGGLSSPMSLMYAVAAALCLKTTAPEGSGVDHEGLVREEVLGALAPRRALIVFDRCDEFAKDLSVEVQRSLAEFLQLVLQRAPRVKLLLTSRKAVQLAGFSPHIVSCSELSVDEAAALLKQMAPGTPKQHSETIAELCGCMRSPSASAAARSARTASRRAPTSSSPSCRARSNEWQLSKISPTRRAATAPSTRAS